MFGEKIVSKPSCTTCSGKEDSEKTTFMKQMDLLPSARGLRSIRENSTHSEHQEIETDISGIIYL